MKCINNTYSFCSQVNVCVCVIVCHLYDFCRLFPILHHVQFGSAVSLIISDVDGDLRGLQPLKPVTFTATPLIDILQEKEIQEMENVNASCLGRQLEFSTGMADSATINENYYIER